MTRGVRLIHWNHEEADERAALLSRAGYEVSFELPRSAAFLRELGAFPPAAIIVDLSRLPSQGRDLGLYLRKNAGTRRIPLVFVGGDETAVQRVQKVLPDAVFTSWKEMDAALRSALAHPPSSPYVPESVFEGYSGTPLPKKLGIKSTTVVGLMAAPADFAQTLGPLPENSELRAEAKGRCDLLVCFVRSVDELERRIKTIARRTDFASAWLAWPKKASGVITDLTEKIVRERGLAAGLVDYKICAIDATWSGLLFARRKKQSAQH